MTAPLAQHAYESTAPGVCGAMIPIAAYGRPGQFYLVQCGLNREQHPSPPQVVPFVPTPLRCGATWFTRTDRRGHSLDDRSPVRDTLRCERLLTQELSSQCPHTAFYQVWCVDGWVVTDDHDLCQFHAIERVERVTHDGRVGLFSVRVRAIPYELPRSSTTS